MGLDGPHQGRSIPDRRGHLVTAFGEEANSVPTRIGNPITRTAVAIPAASSVTMTLKLTVASGNPSTTWAVSIPS